MGMSWGIDVKEHGARGNGATDDTAAIQTVIDTVGAAGGGIVLFPPGNYRTTKSLTCTADGVTLQGAGFSSKISAAGDFDTVRIAGASGRHVYGNRICDLYFDDACKSGGHTLACHFVAEMTIERVTGVSGFNAWHLHNFNNIAMSDCRFVGYRGSYCGRATGFGPLELIDRGDASDVLRMSGVVLAGVGIPASEQLPGVPPGTNGLELDGHVHTVIGTSVHFVSLLGKGLLVRNTVAAKHPPTFLAFFDLEADFLNHEGVRLEAGRRMWFTNSQLHGTFGNFANIYIDDGVESVSFTGGFSSGARQAGLATDGTDVTISAMHFIANGQSTGFPGIIVGFRSEHTIVTGCRSSGSGGAGCQVDNGAKAFLITSNDFHGNPVPLLVGTATGHSADNVP